jgi:hypothetical protein
VLAALVTAAGALTSCAVAVTPAVTFDRWSFEGFDVVSYIPDHPRALAYLFHGSGGGASFAEKVETVDVLNTLIARGYGFVATSSTERTGDRRWDAQDASPTTNPDLARLDRLQDHLVATTGVEAKTPLVGIGMSNGARFVTLWGQTEHDAGAPVAAIWATSGRIAGPVAAHGGLTVPTVFSTCVNDTAPEGQILADYARTRDAGTPAQLHVSQERDLGPSPYLRIPGIDRDEANAIVDAFVATGVWDEHGHRVIADFDTAAARAATVHLPASVRHQAAAIQDETKVILATHQFTAEFKVPVADFFDAHLATT